MTGPTDYPMHRTIVALHSGTRFEQEPPHLRRTLYELVRDSLREEGLVRDDTHVRVYPDRMLILIPADVPKVVVTDRWRAALALRLDQHNAEQAADALSGVRMAVHAGEVLVVDDLATGPAVHAAFRLLDSAALRTASAPGSLSMIVSDLFFGEVVKGTDEAAAFQRVRVEAEDAGAVAWLRTGVPGAVRADRADFAVLYDSEDAEWAEWVAYHLRQAGYSAVVDARALTPTGIAAGGSAAIFDRADRVVVVVSPNLSSRESHTAAWLPGDVAAVQVAKGGSTRPFRLLCNIVGVGAEEARRRVFAMLGILGGTDDEPRYPGHPGRLPLPVVRVEPRAPELVLVHAARDGRFAEELAESLAGLVGRRGPLSRISNRSVSANDIDLQTEVYGFVRDADVVVLVVSRNLLATQYGSSRELRVVMDRHEREATVVLPVVYRATSWEDQPFGSLAPLPTGGRPVAEWESQDEALLSVVEGVRFAALELRGGPPMPIDAKASERRSLGEVFTVAGVPTVTFVEPEDFAEFRMALRQPGLGIVLEGPSGIGKTTLLRNAVALDSKRLGDVTVLSARNPADLPAIAALPGKHEGMVAVDDFQRLSVDLQNRLADYLKLLADNGSQAKRLVLLGIPGTARSLVSVGTDVATRIRVFRLGAAVEGLVMRMIEQGENALNIAFDRRAEISRASAGSLLTAQMLCWQIAVTAGVEQTGPSRKSVRTDLAHARAKVTERLKLKYHDVVVDFITRDRPDEAVCVDLLLDLARAEDGIVKLDGQRADLFRGLRGDHLFHDPRGQRLVVDDPQFRFYLGQLHRDDLLDLAGKRLPVPRDQVFVCYSHQDAHWLGRLQVHLKPLRLDVWSDRRIELGDDWQREITQALARARAALVLVSADALASDYINSEELPHLLAAAEDGGCRIIPVLVGPSLFHSTPSLSRFQGVPAKSTLSELPSHDGERVLADLAVKLSQLFG
ncbi:TIR domain-containing protein [Saccharothrix sp. NRRL B-16314]|uniref:TIR domain-containing protein n=1 Tax=Saccharothrix sp. NRRL B-16314 TaxID=1463825 RepID=UPI00068F7B0E|nr:TIR domain-containing protein [Saccharothrix sp. NRRL B-16314]